MKKIKLSGGPGRGRGAVDFAMGAALGALVFFALYGFAVVNPANDGWIFNGYIEEDIIQSYAGWLYYRGAPWAWPPLVAENLAVPYGTSIAFTDSIPLAAFIAKLFAPLLPPVFQYYGLLNLLYFMLQGGFALLLLRQFGLSRPFSLVGGLLFTCFPAFVERAFRHTSLTAHWVVLAALWLYFKARHSAGAGGESRRRMAGFPALGFCLVAWLSVSLHSYFVPMVFALMLAALVDYVLAGRRAAPEQTAAEEPPAAARPILWPATKRRLLKAALCLGAGLAGCVPVAYLCGLLTRGGGGGAWGFGEYSMNLNAPLNPLSVDFLSTEGGALGGHILWSRFLPALPQNFRQYDGFNYLGAGLLLCLAAMALYSVVRGIAAVRRGDGALFQRAGAFLKGHIPLLAVCFCLAVFALSNVVTLGESTLLSLPLLGPLATIGAMFRASGRMFWVCGYLLLLSALVWLGRVLKGRWALVGVVALAALQLADISGALAEKHRYFHTELTETATEYNSQGMRFLMENHDRVQTMTRIIDYRLSAACIRYNPGVSTNMILANRGEFPQIDASYQELTAFLCSGQPLPEDTLYVFEDVHVFHSILPLVHPDAKGYTTGSYYYIAQEKPGCPLPPIEPEE